MEEERRFHGGRKEVPCCLVLCLLNDNSQFPMSTHE